MAEEITKEIFTSTGNQCSSISFSVTLIKHQTEKVSPDMNKPAEENMRYHIYKRETKEQMQKLFFDVFQENGATLQQFQRTYYEAHAEPFNFQFLLDIIRPVSHGTCKIKKKGNISMDKLSRRE